MSLIVGNRIGPYEITGSLGAGGMGEVYRARDTRLKREVALKILPQIFANDPERLARFQREAEVLASLNHPNIAAIHGLEESDGIEALVMELVDGETLADRIARGAIPVDDALPIARQIAEALEAAHERGIIHRDLKPANIKVRPDGTVKVLDFGLAKALDSAPAIDASRSPTITTPAMLSGAGGMLGTAAYMSPEQARGKPADKRSDIWAFGCVLYEMLTGRRAFHGESVADTLVSILSQKLDWASLPPATPPHVRRLLGRCIAADPRGRLRHIGDALLELTPADGAAGQETVSLNVSVGRRERTIWAAAAVALAVVAALVTAWWRPSVAQIAPPTVRFTILPPDGWAVPRAAPRVGRTNAADSSLALSPDGRRLAFIGAKDGQSVLFVQALDSLTAQSIAGTEGASSPFWSPDGNFVGFFAADKLKKVDLAGGAPVTLCDAENPRGGTWGADTILFGTQGRPLHRVSTQGGIPVRVTTLAAGQTNHARPYFLPGGRRFLFRAQTAAGPSPEWMRGPVYVGSLDSDAVATLIDSDSGNVQYSDGRLLFMRGRSLLAQAFDPETITMMGEPVQLAEGLEVSGNPPVAKFSAAAGNLVYRTGNAVAGRSSLTWFDRSGKRLGTVGSPQLDNDLELAPDGSRVALSRIDAATNTSDLWVVDSARQTRLTFDTAQDGSPIWAPDGSSVVFRSNRSRVNDLYRKSSNGSGDDEVLFESSWSKSPTDWSDDGRFLLFESTDSLGTDIWAMPLVGDRKPFAFADSPYDERSAQFSPDGRWVAYVSMQSGPPEVYVRPFPGPGGQWQVSTGGGGQPRWSSNGRELFYIVEDGTLMATAVSAVGDSIMLATPTPLFQTRILGAGTNDEQYDVAPDGRFLVNVPIDEGAVTPITVLLHWATN